MKTKQQSVNLMKNLAFRSVLRKEQSRICVENIEFLAEKAKNSLNLIGIPPHIKGYRYLQYGIAAYCLYSGTTDGIQITKGIYPLLAEIFLSTPAKIERNMRYAIMRLCDKEKTLLYNELFSRLIPEGEFPTNSVFLTAVANYTKST